MRYWPVPSVTTVRTFSVNAGLDASTVTPGRMAPDESLTTPAMVACANAARGRISTAASTTRALIKLRTLSSITAGFEDEVHPRTSPETRRKRRHYKCRPYERHETYARICSVSTHMFGVALQVDDAKEMLVQQERVSWRCCGSDFF